MKKVLILVLAIVMTIGMVACGSGTTSPSPSASPSPTTTQQPGSAEPTPAEPQNYKIGISQPFMGHPIRKAGQILIDEWAAEHPNVEIMVTDGQLNAQKQIADIEDLMARQIDVLLVAAHQSPTLVGVLRQVRDAGIPIIAFDRTLTDASVQVGHVINDDYNAGKTAAELLIEAIGGGGDVAVLQGPAGNTTVALRNNGFFDAIVGKDINVVSDQVANFQRVQAVEIFENVLQANPNIKGVYCHNDEMALGVMQVLEATDRMDIKVVGIDGQKDALESIKAGKLYGTVRKIVEFPTSLDMAIEYLETGEIKESLLMLESAKINADNVDDYYDSEAVF